MDTTTAPAGEAAATPASETSSTTLLDTTAPAAEGQQQPEPMAEKPEWLPDKYWREGKADYESMAKSHAGLEKLLGRKAQAVVIPTEKSTPEEVAEFRKALGIPEKADDYLGSLKPQTLPEGVQFDEGMAKAAAELAHKHNIPPAAMKELAALQMNHVQAMTQASEQMVMQQLQEGKQQLQTEFGDKFGEKLELAKRAAVTAGIDPTSRGFADPAMVKLAVWAAEQIAEDKLVSSNASPMQVGRDRAMDIIRNPDNPMHRRYHEGDEDVVRQVRSYLSQK